MKALKTYLLAPVKQAAPMIAGFSLALTSLVATNAPAQAAPRTLAKNAVAQATTQKTTLPDGVYLYGQSAEPDQIGQGYFVFEARQGKLVGALYMPRSSFDCTYGSVEPDKVSLTVINSYDRDENPYVIATERNDSVASRGNPTIAPVGLEGYHRISKVSENDRRILNVCKQNYQQRAWK
ncbi:hypothetical protein [Leptolyngbya sp. FACHB-17]|uniref:hypothetical protein n=1 Tax=unclassified Leptolyngbya TaxID=2650499 RepID=UPI0016800C6F|nr:hypothetical protein [Leptolyngbya sp. FACHB-17]MBD2079666.1 hypothetical protein [Leptolyngbya sp. FACHB-17]